MDMTGYADLFKEEMKEMLEVITQASKEFNDNNLDIIKRSFHTIKSSSRAMGFKKLSKLSELVETHIRDSSSDISEDLILRSIEAIKGLGDLKNPGDDEDIDEGLLIELDESSKKR